MASLADLIERYIASLIEQGEGVAEIQRALIASMFRCAPSQVTYVIASRFSPERGYIVESRRGGGGYIRLVKANLKTDVARLVEEVGDYLSQDEANAYIQRLVEEGTLDTRAAEMMKAALSRNTLQLDLPLRDYLRSSIFKAMLNAYFASSKGEE